MASCVYIPPRTLSLPRPLLFPKRRQSRHVAYRTVPFLAPMRPVHLPKRARCRSNERRVAFRHFLQYSPPLKIAAGAVGRVGGCGSDHAWPGLRGLGCRRGLVSGHFLVLCELRPGGRCGAMTSDDGALTMDDIGRMYKQCFRAGEAFKDAF